MGYAGFWKRFVAALIDSVVTAIGGFVVGLVLGVILGVIAGIFGSGDAGLATLVGNLTGIVVGWLYFALMESSSAQGTLGKMALRIKVTDLNGQQIGFARATGRHFGKIVSALILCIGFMMAGFTSKKQALHDMMAGCLVINRY